jgi:hypothetical protein
MYLTMLANEVNKFGQIFPIHSRRKYKYAELFCVKDTPHFFFQTSFRITCIRRRDNFKSIHVAFSSQGQIIKFFGSVIMFCK